MTRDNARVCHMLWNVLRDTLNSGLEKDDDSFYICDLLVILTPSSSFCDIAKQIPFLFKRKNFGMASAVPNNRHPVIRTLVLLIEQVLDYHTILFEDARNLQLPKCFRGVKRW